MAHVFWGCCITGEGTTIGLVFISNLGALAFPVGMIVVGVLMLAYVVRGVPKISTTSPAQGDVVLVATKSKKKSKGKS